MSLLPITSRKLGHACIALAAITFGLIVLGASVRAHDAGLACPDWPLCFGEVIPTFNLKIAFEWGHRVLAGSVSLGLLFISLLSLRQKELRPFLKPRLLIAWLLLGTQVILGGLTVLLKLAPWTVSAHLILGNSFCLTLLWIACDFYDRETPRARSTFSSWVPIWTTTTVGFLFLQLVLGGLVSSNYAGLACTTFPTCNGESIIPTLSGITGLHVLHRLNGFALLASLAVLTWTAKRNPALKLLTQIALRLVLAQIIIGIANVAFRLPISVTALHTAMAAAIVLTTAMITREVILGRHEAEHAPSQITQMVNVK